MSNRKRIDDFLKFWAEVATEYPEFSFLDQQAHKRVYHQLIMQGVPDEEKKYTLDKEETTADGNVRPSVFNRWIEHFEGEKNTTAYVDPKKDYFCQFYSKDPAARMAKEHIKVYIPLDGKHIEKGVNLIFEFLAGNNISYVGMVGKKIRSDNIVIRLVKEEDVRKLLNFVKKNDYLQEGLLPPTPFAYEEDGIAMVCDRKESFNAIAASLIQVYMAKKRKEKKLEEVSVDDFLEFVLDNYTEEFIIEDEKPFEKLFHYENNPSKRDNYREIISFMMKCQNPAFDFQDFMRHYRESASKVKQQESEELLIDCIDEMSKKYESYERGYANVEAYITTGNNKLLTRNNNLRARVAQSTMRTDVLEKLEKYKIGFQEYLNQVMAERNYDPHQYDGGHAK